MQTLIGNISQLQGNILEVDGHCRRTGGRLDAWETQDASEYQQELEPAIELDGESEYENERTETTHDAGCPFQGTQSTASFDGMSSADGASTYAAPCDIPFSQRVPRFPVPQP